MNFTQIHYFITVARTLSFTKAADMLYITQPAISRHINTMEEELGFPLFTRVNRKLQLTPEGQVLAKELDKVFFDFDSAIRKARNASKTAVGELRVGIVDGLDLDDALSKTVCTLAEECPGLDIALFNFGYEELSARLVDGKLDVAFSRAYDANRRVYLQSKFVAKNRNMLAVPDGSPLSRKKSASFSDLQGQTIILVSETDDDINRQIVQSECTKCDFTPIIKYSPSYHINFIWVKSGLGVSILDERSIIPPEGIVRVPFAQYKNSDVVMVWSEQNTNPVRTVFEEYFFRVNQEFLQQ